MTQFGTLTTCNAYHYHRPEGHTRNTLAVCTDTPGHGGNHYDESTGHMWTSTDWTLYLLSADGRYEVTLRSRRRHAMYESWEMDPNHDDADTDTISTYEMERARFAHKLGGPLSRFAEAARMFIGGDGLDDMIGSMPPFGAGDVEWAKYNAAELEAISKAIPPVAEMLLARTGISIPARIDDYMASQYAGCMGCSCSGGMVAKDVVRPPHGGYPADVWVTVRSDAEITEAQAAATPAVHTVES